MQCISEKFQLSQIAFLTENREGIDETSMFQSANLFQVNTKVVSNKIVLF